MATGKKEVTICTEVDTLLQLLVTGVKDVKSGKVAKDVVSDLVPGLISALTSVGELQNEVKDRVDLERTVALKVCDVVDAVVGA